MLFHNAEGRPSVCEHVDNAGGEEAALVLYSQSRAQNKRTTIRRVKNPPVIFAAITHRRPEAVTVCEHVDKAGGEEAAPVLYSQSRAQGNLTRYPPRKKPPPSSLLFHIAQQRPSSVCEHVDKAGGKEAALVLYSQSRAQNKRATIRRVKSRPVVFAIPHRPEAVISL
jgi:hypothetical protein